MLLFLVRTAREAWRDEAIPIRNDPLGRGSTGQRLPCRPTLLPMPCNRRDPGVRLTTLAMQ